MEFQVPVMVVIVILDQVGYLGRIRVFSQDHTILQEKEKMIYLQMKNVLHLFSSHSEQKWFISTANQNFRY